MTVGNIIESWKDYFLPGECAKLDTELLLTKALGCQRMHLYTRWERALNEKQKNQFQFLLRKRKTGQPMAYILKKKEFYGYEFYVEPGVFIPRPETETLVSSVLAEISHKKKLNMMDFGCGSGCVGLSLLTCFPKAHLTLVDLSKKALQVSRINSRRRGVLDRVCFLNKDVSSLDRSADFMNTKKDLIVANPPYIAFNDKKVEAGVLVFEPSSALFSGEQGFYHIRSWLKTASRMLKPGGMYFFEVGAEQDISSIPFTINKLRRKNLFKDLSGRIRVIQYQKYNG